MNKLDVNKEKKYLIKTQKRDTRDAHKWEI